MTLVPCLLENDLSKFYSCASPWFYTVAAWSRTTLEAQAAAEWSCQRYHLGGAHQTSLSEREDSFLNAKSRVCFSCVCKASKKRHSDSITGCFW